MATLSFTIWQKRMEVLTTDAFKSFCSITLLERSCVKSSFFSQYGYVRVPGTDYRKVSFRSGVRRGPILHTHQEVQITLKRANSNWQYNFTCSWSFSVKQTSYTRPAREPTARYPYKTTPGMTLKQVWRLRPRITHNVIPLNTQHAVIDGRFLQTRLDKI